MLPPLWFRLLFSAALQFSGGMLTAWAFGLIPGWEWVREHYWGVTYIVAATSFLEYWRAWRAACVHMKDAA